MYEQCGKDVLATFPPWAGPESDRTEALIDASEVNAPTKAHVEIKVLTADTVILARPAFFFGGFCV